MPSDCFTLPYSRTGSFSKLVADYLSGAQTLRPFYRHLPNLAGLEAAMAARDQFETPRKVLQQVLMQQYEGLALTGKQQQHLDALGKQGTYTIVTAHQPNIFTGPLYFIYKILHAIRLADLLSAQYPGKHFVPVYYMGSEDADLDELGHLYVNGEKLTWQTNQVGAVGRMHTKGLNVIIDRLKGQFGNLPHGAEMAQMLEDAYLQSANIQEATLKLLHHLFSSFGLIVLIPDHADLKRVFIPVIKRELLEQFSSKEVMSTIERLQENYKVQASGREINLFYLFDDGRRERIEKKGDGYRVLFSDLEFSEAEILGELEAHPERFSPNVILRGVFQETILPNIAFVGGGGELAYWLELQDVFSTVGVPYPVLILRNSFLLMNERANHLVKKFELDVAELFLPLQELEDLQVTRKHGNRSDTVAAREQLNLLYRQLEAQAGVIDPTLAIHVKALLKKAEAGVIGLEKKMQRAERRNIRDENRQLEKLKDLLFPKGNLQERVENFMPFFALYGHALLQILYNKSLGLEQEFTVIALPPAKVEAGLPAA